ncbi:hypothetical protein AAG906_021371 [Vitis piasezkii]
MFCNSIKHKGPIPLSHGLVLLAIKTGLEPSLVYEYALEGEGSPRAMSRLIIAIKRTKGVLPSILGRGFIASRLLSLCQGLVMVQDGGAMLKRNKRMVMATQGRLMLTNGSPKVVSKRRIDSFSSPAVYNLPSEEKIDGNGDGDGDGVDDGYWSTVVEEIRWDTMFQDMKPT